MDASSEATTVSQWRRSAGPFTKTPMFDDGQHMDGAAGDGVYGAELPAYLPGTRVDYYVGAATDLASGGAMTFFPKYAERAPLRVNLPLGSTGNSITINEFMAKNDNGITVTKYFPASDYGQHGARRRAIAARTAAGQSCPEFVVGVSR